MIRAWFGVQVSGTLLKQTGSGWVELVVHAPSIAGRRRVLNGQYDVNDPGHSVAERISLNLRSPSISHHGSTFTHMLSSSPSFTTFPVFAVLLLV